ncbi:hypothetical protein ACFQ3S_16350 [Mucilaginibacter terrae]|uniref:hypothetical protein n=1 Tax=Mucilaginibacter terrae TaxID=1955052 RepID=UPI003630310C
MKIFKLIAFISIIICKAAVGQISTNSDYKKFANSFSEIIKYKAYRNNICVPTICLIKIEVDTNWHVQDLSLSSSADSILKKEFDKNKHNIDIISLEKYLKLRNNKYTTFLIPLSYTLFDMPCPQQNIDVTAFDNYYKFNGKEFNGTVTFLEPFNYKITIRW